MAVELGRPLFMDRHNFKIVLLENETKVSFITSDQPIINTCANATSFSPPDKLEVYYPLSPSKAMLYLEKTTPAASSKQFLTIDEVRRYNMMMLEHRAFCVFSDSLPYLRLLAR